MRDVGRRPAGDFSCGGGHESRPPDAWRAPFRDEEPPIEFVSPATYPGLERGTNTLRLLKFIGQGLGAV